MKNYILTGALLLAFSLNKSQVIINKDASQTLSSDSVLLEFGSEKKGLLLPWVTNAAAVTGAVPGTMIFDISDKKVKYLRDASNPTWFDLTTTNDGKADISLQNLLDENLDAKTIIGSSTSDAPGILVLEAPGESKAMVLPKVASPHLNIIDPAPGMIVFDTVSKQLAVFNGEVWSFWKH